MFVNGKTEYGDFFDHLLPWYDRKDDANVLFLTYEQMKEDPVRSVLKLAGFLGEHYKRRLLEDGLILENVLANSSVSFMRELLECSPSKFQLIWEKDPDAINAASDPQKAFFRHIVSLPKAEEHKSVNLVRKGIVGDYKAHLTNHQLHRMKLWIESKTSGNDIMTLWAEHPQAD